MLLRPGAPWKQLPLGAPLAPGGGWGSAPHVRHARQVRGHANLTENPLGFSRDPLDQVSCKGRNGLKSPTAETFHSMLYGAAAS